MTILARLAGALVLGLALSATPAAAQDYPTQPVRILVGCTAGSGPVAIRAVLRVPAVAKVVQQASYVPDERTAAQTAEFFKSEVEAVRESVEAANIKPI